MSTTIKVAKFSGGTAFVVAASTLGYLTSAGEWTVPGEATVPMEDADAFEELLIEANIPHHRNRLWESR